MSKYIIEVDDNAVSNGCYSIVGTNNVLVSPNGLDELQKYEESVEEVEEEQTFPQIGDIYYCLLRNGAIDNCAWADDSYDRKTISIGNCFHTKEEAEFALERLKVLAEMRKFAEPFDTKWDGDTRHYYIYYGVKSKSLDIDYHVAKCGGEIYFESGHKANECIKAVGEDRIKKYYLGVE